VVRWLPEILEDRRIRSIAPERLDQVWKAVAVSTRRWGTCAQRMGVRPHCGRAPPEFRAHSPGEWITHLLAKCIRETANERLSALWLWRRRAYPAVGLELLDGLHWTVTIKSELLQLIWRNAIAPYTCCSERARWPAFSKNKNRPNC
jgi:hypothetical protein